MWSGKLLSAVALINAGFAAGLVVPSSADTLSPRTAGELMTTIEVDFGKEYSNQDLNQLFEVKSQNQQRAAVQVDPRSDSRLERRIAPGRSAVWSVNYFSKCPTQGLDQIDFRIRVLWNGNKLDFERIQNIEKYDLIAGGSSNALERSAEAKVYHKACRVHNYMQKLLCTYSYVATLKGSVSSSSTYGTTYKVDGATSTDSTAWKRPKIYENCVVVPPNGKASCPPVGSKTCDIYPGVAVHTV